MLAGDEHHVGLEVDALVGDADFGSLDGGVLDRDETRAVCEFIRGLGEQAAEGLGVVVGRVPGEEGEVGVVLEDGFLQTQKGFAAFSVDQRQVDVEDAEEAVSAVFLALRPAARGPRHAPRDGHFVHRGRVLEDLLVDAGDAREEGLELRLGADVVPVLVEEGNVSGCDKFLERPAAGEPAALPELRSRQLFRGPEEAAAWLRGCEVDGG